MMKLLTRMLGLPAEAVSVLDEQIVHGKDAVFTVAQIGDKRSLTPEGFLFCEEVPICRTGDMLYGPRETPVTAGPEGYVIVTREEAEVFRPEFVRSFEGKPFLLNHPPERLVTIDTIKRYQRGHVMNPRRGEGDLRDFLICDVLVTCPEVIELINSDKMREVSAGYTAEYEEIEPKGQGRARQYQMLGNHLALVKNARCGTRCSIQDNQGETDMRLAFVDEATLDVTQLRDTASRRLTRAVMDALKAKNIVGDEAAILAEARKVIDELPVMMPGGTAKDAPAISLNVHGTTRDEEAHTKLGALEARMNNSDSLFGKMRDFTGYKDPEEKTTDGDDDDEKKKKEAAEKEAAAKDSAETAKRIEEESNASGDAAKAATDSALLSGAHQEAAAGAEILLPGITIPKFDATAKPRATLDSICGLRRSAMELAYATPDGKSIIDRLTGGKKPNFATMDCAAERLMFRAAVNAKKTANDAASVERAAAAKLADKNKVTGKTVIRTAGDLNRRANEFWKGQKSPAGQE